jgi:hypothetical protein
MFILLFLVGCNTPDDNKKEIQKIKEEMASKSELILVKTKLNEVESKVKNLEENLSNIVKTQKQTIKNIEKLKKQQKQQIKKQIKPTILTTSACMYKVIKPTTFITIKDINVYKKPENNSSIVFKWKKCTTFTSYKEKNGFVKVTGYFVHNKWVANYKDWWIRKCDIKVKKVFK